MYITHCMGPIRIPPNRSGMLWREGALCYCPGKTLDVGMCMPGFRLMLQDDKGEYPHSGRALIFKGSMLVYGPQWDIAQWVPIRGTSATLTMSEWCAANDLNNMVPSPIASYQQQSQHPLKCVLVGAESDSSVIDSGDEWIKPEELDPRRAHSYDKNRSHMGGVSCCCLGRRKWPRVRPHHGRTSWTWDPLRRRKTGMWRTASLPWDTSLKMTS